MNQLDATFSTNVEELIASMRVDRGGMVQTGVQAEFVYVALETYAFELNAGLYTPNQTELVKDSSDGGYLEVTSAVETGTIDHDIITAETSFCDEANTTAAAAPRAPPVHVTIHARRAAMQQKLKGKLGSMIKKKKGRIGLFIRTTEQKKNRQTNEDLDKEIVLGADEEPTKLTHWDEVKLVDLSRCLPKKHVANNAQGTQLIYKSRMIQPCAPAAFSSCSWQSLNEDEIVQVKFNVDTNNFSSDVTSKIALVAFSRTAVDDSCVPYKELLDASASSIAAKASEAGAKALVLVSPQTEAESFILKSCKNEELNARTFKHPLLGLFIDDGGDEDEDEDEDEPGAEDEDDADHEGGAVKQSTAPALPLRPLNKDFWIRADECTCSAISQSQEDWMFDLNNANGGKIQAIKWKDGEGAEKRYNKKAVIIPQCERWRSAKSRGESPCHFAVLSGMHCFSFKFSVPTSKAPNPLY